MKQSESKQLEFDFGDEKPKTKENFNYDPTLGNYNVVYYSDIYNCTYTLIYNSTSASNSTSTSTYINYGI